MTNLKHFHEECKKLTMKQVKAKINGHGLNLQVAETKEQQKNGLMHRQTLDKDSGMIFVYNQPIMASFWMKNTKIPLSIAFVGQNNEIFQIEDMIPGDLTSVKSLKPCKYAIEVNKGWFEDKNIKLKDIVSFPKNIYNKKRTIKIKIESV